MQQVFIDKRINDIKCVNDYEIPNILLMENAANALSDFIAKKCKKNKKQHSIFELNKNHLLDFKQYDSNLIFDCYLKSILVANHLKNKPLTQKVVFLCGGGDNGADGIASARLLNTKNPHLDIIVILLKQPKSKLCVAQYNMLAKIEYGLDSNANSGSLNILKFYDFFDWHIDNNHIKYMGKDSFLQSLCEIFTSNANINIDIYKLIEHYNDMESSLYNKLVSHYIDSISSCNLALSHYNILQDIINILKPQDIIIDCIFGSGFSQNISLKDITNYQNLRLSMSNSKTMKIACDTPSALPNVLGDKTDIDNVLCKVDYTFCMGAINLSMLDSRLKDMVGKIKIVDLGIPKTIYQQINKDSNYILLEKQDLQLPIRTIQNSNKGSYGNVFVIGGEMIGASVLSAMSALHFGAGKVHIYNGFLSKSINIQNAEIILTDKIPNKNQNNITSFAIGMGLGYNDAQYKKLFDFIKNISSLEELNFTRGVMQPSFMFDADILYRAELYAILPYLQKVVITPHPKEFQAVLQHTGIIINKDINYVIRNISSLSLEFSNLYPHVVCLIKGANTSIVHNNRLYIHMQGQCNLAKGGSGDVLSGMVASLLAQGMDSFESCKNASLAHAKASKIALKKWQNYALTPYRLIEILSKI